MEIADLDRWLAERNLNGHWNHQARAPKVQPHLWKWADINEGLQMAGESVPMDKTFRRTIQMVNPSLKSGMTHTIHLSVQLVKPGEIAKAHRHVAGAIRYIIKGSPKGCTIVEGEKFPMEEGDLITTPNWTWHDHYNGSDEPIMWLDGLDVRLVGYFGAQFQENFVKDRQPVERPDDYSSKILGHARPSWINSGFASPPFRYKWQETYETLLTLKESEGDPFDGVRLEYVNPFTGGPTLPTFYGGRFHHSNHPVMNWMMSNVTVKPDKNDNIFPNKSTPEAKIDGPAALFTAMSRMLVNGGEQQDSLSDHLESYGVRSL